MAIKHKSIEVSAKKPLFGGQSEMDKVVEKWTSEGWTLTNTTASSRNNYYLLSFEYETEEDETRSGTSRRGVGCAVALGVIVALAAVCNVINSPSPSKESAQPSVVAQVATQITVVKPTQEPNKNQSIQSSTAKAVTTKIPSTSTPIPARKLPTATPQPTVVLAVAKSGTINARSCASTDCAIVGTIAAGEKVSVIGQQDKWYLVELDNKKSGYVRSDLLIMTSDSQNISASYTPKPQTSNVVCKPTFMQLGGGFVLKAHHDDPKDLQSTYTYTVSENKTYEASIDFGKNWDVLEMLKVKNFDLDRKGFLTTESTQINYGFETSIDVGFVNLAYDFEYQGRAFTGDIIRYDYEYTSQVRNTMINILEKFVGAVIC